MGEMRRGRRLGGSAGRRRRCCRLRSGGAQPGSGAGGGAGGAGGCGRRWGGWRRRRVRTRAWGGHASTGGWVTGRVVFFFFFLTSSCVPPERERRVARGGNCRVIIVCDMSLVAKRFDSPAEMLRKYPSTSFCPLHVNQLLESFSVAESWRLLLDLCCLVPRNWLRSPKKSHPIAAAGVGLGHVQCKVLR